MKTKSRIISKFKKLWPHYILQGLLAGFVLLIIILILGNDKLITIGTIGATTFIVFAMPISTSAQTRNVIGGHMIGMVSGAIFCLIPLPFIAAYPLAVTLVFILMVALDFEHPPAAGTALVLVANEMTWDVFLTIMVSSLVLSQCRYYLRKYLKDLV